MSLHCGLTSYTKTNTFASLSVVINIRMPFLGIKGIMSIWVYAQLIIKYKYSDCFILKLQIKSDSQKKINFFMSEV